MKFKILSTHTQTVSFCCKEQNTFRIRHTIVDTLLGCLRLNTARFAAFHALILFYSTCFVNFRPAFCPGARASPTVQAPVCSTVYYCFSYSSR